MSMCDPSTLATWVSKYKANKHDLVEFGLNYLFDLTSHAINSGLLAHMRSRWNPATTSFHIGGRQICPTLEEFQAILHLDDPYLMSLSPMSGSVSLPSIFQQLVGTSKPMAKTIFKDQKIDLMGMSTLMMHSLDDMPIVTIYGLERSVSYHTAQLFGQYGRKAMPKTKMPVHLFDGPITAMMHKHYLEQISRTSRITIRKAIPGIDEYLVAPTSRVRSDERANSTKKRSTATTSNTQPAKKRKQ